MFVQSEYLCLETTMKSKRVLVALTTIFLCSVASINTDAQDDWPVWRGPTKNGIAPGNQKPPTEWSMEENVVWKTKVPGRGHASPTIVGNQIFLATADQGEQTQSVVCFDRKSGEQQWTTEVNKGGLPKLHPNNTHASQTVVTHDKKLFVVFNNNGGVQLAALDFDGKLIWEKKVGDFKPFYQFGYGSSPCIYNDTVIVMSDYLKDGFIAAYKQSDGEEVWKTKRGYASSYATPIVAKVAGKEQLLVTGSGVRSYNPKTGKELWNAECPWEVSCATPVWNGDMVFVSGGYPAKGTLGINAKNGKIVWQNRIKCYEQSMLVKGGHIFAMSDGGVAYCWKCKDGEEKWVERLKGPVSSSPVLAGGNVYMADERGTTYVFKANNKKYQAVKTNKLGDVSFATPTILNDKIYTRVGVRTDGNVQEWLFCLAEE